MEWYLMKFMRDHMLVPTPHFSENVMKNKLIVHLSHGYTTTDLEPNLFLDV